MPELRPPGPNDSISDTGCRGSRTLLAFLREAAAKQDASGALVAALVAHLIAEGIIAEDWNE